jgi:hypothetical protein
MTAIKVSHLKDQRLKRLLEEAESSINDIHELMGKLEEKLFTIEDILMDISITN